MVRYGRYCGTSNDGKSQRSNYSGLLDPSRDYHDVMQELYQLQNNVALSWDGNLNERAAQLDPDSYALETMRIERARLNLNPNVKKILDSIASAISQSSNDKKNPLFILPIDDFDLNPVACLELLRILRMLSVPRLFTLMLGDLEVVDVVLNLKMSNDLNSVCPEIREEMVSITSNYVARTAGRIAADSIHKLLPPMQCVQLRPMHSFEALNFFPLGNTSDPDKVYLYQKLALCPMEFGTHIKEKTNEKPPYDIENIAEFLISQGLPVFPSLTGAKNQKIIDYKPKSGDIFTSKDLSNAFYSGIHMLNTIPRFVIDIWFTFNRFIDPSGKTEKTEEWTTEVKLVAELCQNILLRDRALDPITRSHTRSGLFNDHLGGWDLEALPISTRSVLDNGTDISNSKNSFVKNSKNPNLKCHFSAFKAMGWRFQLSSSAKIDKTPKKNLKNISSETVVVDGVEYKSTHNNYVTTDDHSRDVHGIQYDHSSDVHGIQYDPLGKEFKSTDHLGTDTSGALILFHDLLALGPTYRSHSFLLKPGIDHVTDKSWCLTTWQKGLARKVDLPWYRPRCRSFWGLDLFRYAWNNLLESEEIEKTPTKLAFTWISAGTGVITNQEPITIQDRAPKKDDWKKIGKKLNTLALKENKGQGNDQARLWLIGIALMIMPETGLPDISGLYEDQADLADFWKQHARSIRDYRGERLKKFINSNMNELAKDFYDCMPSRFIDTWDPKNNNVRNSQKENDIHYFRPFEVGEELGSDRISVRPKKPLPSPNYF